MVCLAERVEFSRCFPRDTLSDVSEAGTGQVIPGFPSLSFQEEIMPAHNSLVAEA